MRILLLGADGQLGRALVGALGAVGTLECATRGGRFDGGPCHRADLEVPAETVDLLRRLRPSVLVNAAAYTAVDLAESEPGLAFRVNAEAPAELAVTAAELGVRLIHYSTDYVYGSEAGRSRPWQEEDEPAPASVYAASKLAGDRAVAAAGGEYLILRTSWLYAPHGHNFLRTVLRLAKEREDLHIVDDQIGSPTAAGTVARATAIAVGTPASSVPSGVFHVAARGETSWHGFAQAILEGSLRRGLLRRAPRLHRISTEEFAAVAPRPAYSVLDVQRFESSFGHALPAWPTSLDECLDELATSPGGPSDV